jgi:hypothetical protein
MATQNRYPLGTMFLATLVLSWTLLTAAIAMTMWTERGAPPVRLITWASLWVFSVLAPTLNAFTVHRAIQELTGPTDQLARLRPLLLLYANMTVLSAFALIFGR